MTLPPALQPHLKKINFATLALATLLFLMPWTEVSCSGKAVGTQSGLQAMYGGFSFSDDIPTPPESDPKAQDAKDDIGFGLIITMAFLATLGGAVLAGLVLFKKLPLAPVDPAILASAALVLLLLQLVIGFPLDRSIKDSREEPPGATAADRQFNQNVGAMMNIRSEREPSFYLTLLALAVPVGLFIYSKVPENKVGAVPTGHDDRPTTPVE